MKLRCVSGGGQAANTCASLSRALGKGSSIFPWKETRSPSLPHRAQPDFSVGSAPHPASGRHIPAATAAPPPRFLRHLSLPLLPRPPSPPARPGLASDQPAPPDKRPRLEPPRAPRPSARQGRTRISRSAHRLLPRPSAAKRRPPSFPLGGERERRAEPAGKSEDKPGRWRGRDGVPGKSWGGEQGPGPA